MHHLADVIRSRAAPGLIGADGGRTLCATFAVDMWAGRGTSAAMAGRPAARSAKEPAR
jgi:hypothetical protein